ncbi:MAG TPA: hypothetical protein VM557_13165 [Thermoanaerobaculia bacterium]|nr:hypothetical protein [Thermoanaerobaculia bacterium]
MDRLLSWDRLELRMRGEKLALLARRMLAAKRVPVSLDRLEFREGMAIAEGTLRKGLPIPFRFTLRRVRLEGRIARIPIEDLSVLGFLPVPSLLFRVAEGFAAVDGVTVDPKERGVIIALDRFLPDFVEVEIEAIRFVAGGVAVTMGPGGADLPEPSGGFQ